MAPIRAIVIMSTPWSLSHVPNETCPAGYAPEALGAPFASFSSRWRRPNGMMVVCEREGGEKMKENACRRKEFIYPHRNGWRSVLKIE